MFLFAAIIIPCVDTILDQSGGKILFQSRNSGSTLTKNIMVNNLFIKFCNLLTLGNVNPMDIFKLMVFKRYTIIIVLSKREIHSLNKSISYSCGYGDFLHYHNVEVFVFSIVVMKHLHLKKL